MKRIVRIFTISVALTLPAAAQDNPQPYKELESQAISSLSDQDIAALREGTGWGLALPAELNGHPGPAHVLELSESLDLSDEQNRMVQAIFDEMQAEAIAKGAQLIEAERALDDGFKSEGLTEDALRDLIGRAEKARADLRFVHLSRHLMTSALLNQKQVAQYASLRGYTSDPCARIPEGHDAEMWRRHNGCSDR